MTRSTFSKRTRRIGIALAIAALAVPTAAQAYPEGVHHQSSSKEWIFVPSDPGQQRLIHPASPAFVPMDPGQFRITDQSAPRTHTYTPLTVTQPSTPVTVTTDSGFDWTDALIGAGVTAGLLMLAFGGAILARRQGGLTHR